jgi:hypothetical protein
MLLSCILPGWACVSEATRTWIAAHIVEERVSPDVDLCRSPPCNPLGALRIFGMAAIYGHYQSYQCGRLSHIVNALKIKRILPALGKFPGNFPLSFKVSHGTMSSVVRMTVAEQYENKLWQKPGSASYINVITRDLIKAAKNVYTARGERSAARKHTKSGVERTCARTRADVIAPLSTLGPRSAQLQAQRKRDTPCLERVTGTCIRRILLAWTSSACNLNSSRYIGDHSYMDEKHYRKAKRPADIFTSRYRSAVKQRFTKDEMRATLRGLDMKIQAGDVPVTSLPSGVAMGYDEQHVHGKVSARRRGRSKR